MIAARDSQLLSERQFRDNMVSVFLAGHENPQLLLTSMIFLLGEHQVGFISKALRSPRLTEMI